MEEQFRQSQKMEAVGRLAGGVAHDFNNLLTVINGYSKLILRTIQTDERNLKRLTEIHKAGERAADLTRQLLAFSRRQILQPQIVNLNMLLSELLKLLQPLIGEDIELSLALGNDLGLVKIDPGQFEQSIINMAVNARDAMPDGGRLTIATQRVNLGNDYVGQFPEIKAGRYIQVTVSDSGHGMDEETSARIFEPFFTTKGPGKGTGLGLAMVYGFVKQSDGHIAVMTEVGRGTTFRIYLPNVAEAAPTHMPPLELAQIPQGSETVLLVEDEDAVRGLVKQVLETGGYTVLEAHNGPAAIAMAQQYANRIHILVTDLIMPRMSGRQLADYLTQTRPEMRVLFMSGYTDEAVVNHGVSQAGIAFLQKPFDPLHLAKKVREVLNASR
ncbi:MAG: response regulator [Caldilineaceae bacterium]